MKKKLSEAELLDAMIEWIDALFETHRSEIIIKGDTRDYVIVPDNRKKMKQ